MDWINKMYMITEKLKSQMYSRGIDSLDKVFLIISSFDQYNYNFVEKIDFENFLSKLGIFLKKQVYLFKIGIKRNTQVSIYR